MKTPKQMAEALYKMLKEDSKGCFDTSVDLYDEIVTYKDQGGLIGVDFDRKTITIKGYIDETFNCVTNADVAEQYVNDDTISVEFFKGPYGFKMASVTNQYKDYDGLKSEMECHGVFLGLDDFDKIFK